MIQITLERTVWSVLVLSCFLIHSKVSAQTIKVWHKVKVSLSSPSNTYVKYYIELF